MSRVIVLLNDEEQGHAYTGNYDAGVTPGNCLIVSETVPDVTGKSKEGAIARIRTIYNPSKWYQAGVTDDVEPIEKS